MQLDNDYFEWLIRDVLPIDINGPSFYIIMDVAFSIRFREIIPNDDNRAQDGLQLRTLYGYDRTDTLPSLLPECTVLEMLIGLCRRMSEISWDWDKIPELDNRYWFWRLLNNLNIDSFDDARVDPMFEEHIRKVFTNVVNRQYRKDGYGGLFPRLDPEEDQRDVEIWYQMHGWLEEND